MPKTVICLPRYSILFVSSDDNLVFIFCFSMQLQSLLRLKEPSVLLRCREMDSQLVNSILDAAKQEYAEKAKVHAPKITVDEHVYLPPPPAGDGAHGPSW